MNDDKYAKMRPVDHEGRYVEYDEEFGCWAIFGDESGFCYSQHSSKEAAEEQIKD